MANEVYAADVVEPEGPVFADDGSLYLVEMGPGRRCLTHIARGGARRSVATTRHRPNGLARDGDGRLWIAEAYEGAIICVAPDGKVVKRIEGSAAEPFLWPNDLVFGPDGRLYMSDSGIREEDFIDGTAIHPDFASKTYDGRVYEIDPVAGRVLRKLDSGIRFTNGIALAPDGQLYANETIGGAVYRYDIRAGKSAARQVFGNVLRAEKAAATGFCGPDGMKFGADGRLYCTVYGQGDVTVLDRDGTVAERIATNGAKPTNIAFTPEGSAAVVTEVALGQVERIRTPCPGAPLHYPHLAL
jgi:gluconolactonase